MLTVGLDIGGANTKIAACSTREGRRPGMRAGRPCVERIESRYFPFWQQHRRFPGFLRSILRPYLGRPHRIVVTTTAELADCFQTKRQGVRFILSALANVDPSADVLLNSGRVVGVHEGLSKPLMVAAANWLAPVLLVGPLLPDSILIDAGSTTTDIIPISQGRHQVKDPTDMGRLANHQLVYTGSLRTNVATIVDHIPVGGGTVGVSSESFATTADVNLLLELIRPKDFTVPTSDGGPATRKGAMRRLSRLVCADTESLSKRDIIRMAAYIHSVQVSKVSQHIKAIADRYPCPADLPCVLAGIGASTLAEPAARAAGLSDIRTFHHLLKTELGVLFRGRPKDLSADAPAASLAIVGAKGDFPCG